MSKATKNVKATTTPATPAVETAPVIAAVETPVAPAAPTVPTYNIGKTPRLGNDNMNDTKRTWEFLATALVAGPLTIAELQKLAKVEYNHQSFVKYAVKNGWYILQTADQFATAAAAVLAAAKVAADAAAAKVAAAAEK